MGNWSIGIQGIGPNGNGLDVDADNIARRIVRELKMKGHNITSAIFSNSTKTTDLLNEYSGNEDGRALLQG